MNAKIVKAARRLARQLSAGMPDRQLLGKKRQKKSTKTEMIQAINSPQSTRGVYRAIKNALRQGRSLESLHESKPASPV